MITQYLVVLGTLVLSAQDSCSGGRCRVFWGPPSRSVIQAHSPWTWVKSEDGSRADLFYNGVYVRSHYYEKVNSDVSSSGAGGSSGVTGKVTDSTGKVTDSSGVSASKGGVCDCVSCNCSPCDCAMRNLSSKGSGVDNVVPGEMKPEEPLSQNFGVELDKIGHGPHYALGGVPVSRQKAIDVLTGNGDLIDDSHKLRLTIIGNKQDRQRVLQDVRTIGLDKLFLVQDYPPDHWVVRDVGFNTAGKPSIYLQSPDGVVLHRQDDYRGPEDLQVLRKADPNYRPERDPDLRKPTLPDLRSVPAWVWVLGVVLLLLWSRK